MKRITMLLSMLLLVGMSFADTQQLAVNEAIPLQVSITDPTLEHEPVRLTPIRVPVIYLDSYSLIFSTPCDNCILSITNEYGFVEHVVFITKGTKTLLLPESLLGDYCIKIICGSICFWGYITF